MNSDIVIKNYENPLINKQIASDYISNKKDKQHAFAYAMALDMFLKNELYDETCGKTFAAWKIDFYKNHKIIEIKNKDYTKASEIFVIQYTYPYTKTKYSLNNYWNDFIDRQKDIHSLALSDEDIKYSEIIYSDYVNGYCILKNKLNDRELTIPFNFIDDSIPVNNDININTLFTYLYKN